MTLTWVRKLITCHTPARTPTILAYQCRPSLRAPCLTIPHPPPHPRRTRRRRMTKPVPRRAAMSPTFLRRRSLGSFLAGTSPPVAMEPLASLPILRVRIIPVPCLHLRSIPLLMSNRLILPTFTPCLHHCPSFSRQVAYPLPTIFLLSPHNRPRSPSHRHPRSLCTSVIPRRLCPPCKSPSTPQEHPFQRQDLSVPCPLSLHHTLTLANFLFLSLSHPRPRYTPLLRGHSRLLRHTRNLRLHRWRTSGTLRHLNKMVHKNRLHRRASVHVAIAAQVGVQVFADRHLAVAASHHACFFPLAAAEMGTFFVLVHPAFCEGAKRVAVMIVASPMSWPMVM